MKGFVHTELYILSAQKHRVPTHRSYGAFRRYSRPCASLAEYERNGFAKHGVDEGFWRVAGLVGFLMGGGIAD